MNYRIQLRQLLLLISMCLFGAACAKMPAISDRESLDKPLAEPPVQTADSDSADQIGVLATEVPLGSKSWKEVQDWISKQSGRVVVIDVWSTYCAPCLQEFPKFVDLHNAHRDQVACASLNVDFYGGVGTTVEEFRPQVERVLESQKATMANFICNEPDEEVLKQIGATAVPVVLVYDQAGDLRTVFRNDQSAYGADGFSYEKHIVPLVEDLLQNAE